MAAYLQMGHNTENLVGVGGLEDFAGLVLSPVTDAVVSPAFLPRTWDDSYYGLCADIFADLRSKITQRVLMPVIVDLKTLKGKDEALRIASIVSRHAPKEYYVILDAEVVPRREISDMLGLSVFMFLIRTLRASGALVTVAFSSSDMLLFKYAGATHCATSKFFNLRRFTKTRFDEPPSAGGGQLPYWFEHSLLAFLRQTDVELLQRRGMQHLIGQIFSNNTFGSEILSQLVTAPADPWVGLSWRQYLAWFAKTQKFLDEAGADEIPIWLEAAESNWRDLEAHKILLTESDNDGDWIRPWRQALNEFDYFCGG